MQPSMPASPFPAQPANSGVPPLTQTPNASSPSHKSSKVVPIVIGCVAALAVIVGVVVVVIMMNTVSRQDYAKAKDTLQKAADLSKDTQDSLQDISSTMSYGTVTESDLSDAYDKIKSAHDKYTSTINELGKYKAVVKDQDVNKKYQAVKTAYQSYDKMLTTLEDIYSKDGLRSTIMAMAGAQELSNISSSSDYAGTFRKLSTTFGDIAKAAKSAKVSDDDIQKSVDAVADDCQKLSDTYSKLATAYDNRDAATLQSLASSIQSQSTAAQNSLNDFATKISDLASSDVETKFVDKVNDLGDYLAKKSNGDK